MTAPSVQLDAIPREDIPAALVHLSARLLSEAIPQPPAPDDLLTPADAAQLLGVDVRFVYRHKKELGGLKLSRKRLRFSRRKVQRWLDARR